VFGLLLGLAWLVFGAWCLVLDWCMAGVAWLLVLHIHSVGQNHMYTVYIRYFWQGNHQIYGHIRRTFTVLANPTLAASSSQRLGWYKAMLV
jgi:hypothetical protein